MDALSNWLRKADDMRVNEVYGNEGFGSGKVSSQGVSDATQNRGDTSTDGKKNLKVGESDDEEKGVKDVSGNRGGGSGGADALGIDRENSGIHPGEKRKLAKALTEALGRLPTEAEVMAQHRIQKAMIGGISADNRTEMDTRAPGASSEVSRPEEGGKVDGVGANSGAPAQGGGSQGLHAVSLEGGNAYGATQTGPDQDPQAKNGGKLDKLSDEDPDDIDKMKTGQGPASSQVSDGTSSPGLQEHRVYGNEDHMHKSQFTAQRYPGPTVEEINAHNLEKARMISAAHAQAPDLVVSTQPQRIPEPQPEAKYQVFAKGPVLYTDVSDQECIKALQGNSDGYYQSEAPSFDNAGYMQKSVACANCGNSTPAMFASCQRCGAADMRKSIAPVVNMREAPGLRRPQPKSRDLFLPNGIPSEE